MRTLRWSGLVVLSLLLFVPGVSADEGEQHSATKAAEKALEALKLRLEARIKEGELLSKSGRTEEALEAYRSTGRLYEQGMAEIRRLVASLTGRAEERAPAPRAPDRPFVSPPPAAGDKPAKWRGNPKDAVANAIAWLAAHQSPDGRWGAADFTNWCNGAPVAKGKQRPDGLGKSLYDVGVTGLAVMAFLGAGHTTRGKDPYAKNLQGALRWLRRHQDAEGCFGPRSTQQYIYNHATASLAMIEAYGMTGAPQIKESAQRALDFIAKARNPYFGWRYGVKPGDNDTSVTTWMVMCLKSASLINEDAKRRGKAEPLKFDNYGFHGARAWLDKVTDTDYGRVGYVQRGTGPARPQALVDRFPGEKSEAMTAAGILCRVFMGEDARKSRVIKLGADLCAKLPPVWNPSDGSIDMYYWYLGTMAMFQVGGKHWRLWSKSLDRAVLATQRMDTDACGYKGSWDPIGPWGMEGGRVYSTALMALTVQIYGRYERARGKK